MVGVAHCKNKKRVCGIAVSRTLDLTIQMLAFCPLTKLVLAWKITRERY